MQPVLWQFRNGTDWKFKDGTYSHPLGPGVKKVMLEYSVYYAGMTNDRASSRRTFSCFRASLTTTAGLPGRRDGLRQRHATRQLHVAERQIIITPFLKPGKNEIKLVSGRVKDAIEKNDIMFSILGPAEWMVSENQSW